VLDLDEQLAHPLKAVSGSPSRTTKSSEMVIGVDRIIIEKPSIALDLELLVTR
jgi:hypothetical protein